MPFEIPVSPANLSYADTQFEILMRHILEFQASLDANHDVGMVSVNSGSSDPLLVSEVILEPPVLLVFRGTVKNKPAMLVQHINQLNVLMTPVDKPPEEPHRIIGFTVSPES